MPDETPLTLRFLGEIEVSRGAEPLALPPSKKTRALLAYLAVTGRPHRRERLCALLWDIPDDPRAALRWSLSKLRQLVDEPSRKRIVSQGESVSFDPSGVAVDLLDLRKLLTTDIETEPTERLHQVAATVRGEFLEDLELPNCPEFQAWRTAEREDTAKQHAKLLRDLVRRHADRPEDGLTHARTLVRVDPYDESAHADLIRLLTATGRRQEAEHHYRTASQLFETIGAGPSGALIGAWQERDHASSADDREPAAPSPPDPPQAPTPAERKHVTVLVADLTGTEEPLESLDPEATLHRLDPALQAVMAQVQRYGGAIGQVHGHRLLALFGAPVAHEDHAVRACLAALAMRDAVHESTDGSLMLRAGLHSGEVVVRGVAGDPSRHTEAIGPPIQAATRLAEQAEPGEIVLTAGTHSRAEVFLQTRSVGTAGVPGNPQPVPVFALLGRATADNRWQGRERRELTRFVGREAELERMTRALAQAKSGDGRVVAIVGEPGMGKSRLAHEFLRRPELHGHAILETGAASHGQDASYQPVRDLLRGWFGVEKRDSKSDIAAKVRGHVGGLDEALLPHLPALFSLLDLPAESEDWNRLSPPERRRQLLDVLKLLFVRQSQERPLVLLFEDLHWIDEETQAVLDSLVASLAAARILLLVTYRPEYRHAWADRSAYVLIRAEPLPNKSASKLLRSLLGKDSDLDDLKSRLIARSDGNPLFLEELVRALAETGTLAGKRGHYRLVGPVGSLELPATIQDVLAARIDRLRPRAKDLLQIASVLGTDVPKVLLQRLAQLAEPELRDTLVTLQAAEFLHESRLLPDVAYAFKHVLTRLAAYRGVLRERRRQLHAEVVRAIETVHKARLDEQVDLLAHHAIAGGLWQEAVAYSAQAAAKARERSTYGEAANHLTTAISLVDHLPAETRQETEFTLQAALGSVYRASESSASPQTEAAYERAKQLGETLGFEDRLLRVLYGLFICHFARGDQHKAMQISNKIANIGERTDNRPAVLVAAQLTGSAALILGDFARSLDQLDLALSTGTPDRAPFERISEGQYPSMALNYLSWAQLITGHMDQAMVTLEAALAESKAVSHFFNVMGLGNACYVYQIRKDLRAIDAATDELIDIAEARGISNFLALGQLFRGWSHVCQGATKSGLAMMQAAMSTRLGTTQQVELPYHQSVLAEAYLWLGRWDDCCETLEAAFRSTAANDERWIEAELYRLRGELGRHSGQAEATAVERDFQKALEVARQQGAKLWELRSATSLATLWRDQGKTKQARDVLAPIHRWFTEGLDTPDLKASATLLEELSRARGRIVERHRAS